MNPIPHYIYRAFDADGRLLYIGQTIQPEQRVRKHSAQSPWFADVTKWEFEEVDGWFEMQAAERDAIRSEGPIYNVQHKRVKKEIA